MSSTQVSRGAHRRATTWLPLILTLLLAAGLRFWHLDAQSFWNDEGNTARLVERPVPLIIEGAAGDIHPPGYYLLLAAWRAGVGESEFALRSFSALCGVGMVAVAAAVARRAGGWLPAWGAAALVAVHPLAVYYSQEARMYAQLGLLSALTLWAATKFVYLTRRAPADHWYDRRYLTWVLSATLGLGVCIAAGLYTQYTYVLPLAGLNMAFALSWLTRRPRRWLTVAAWIGAHALAGVLFLPWAPTALGATGWRPPDLNTGESLQAMTRAMLNGVGQSGKTGGTIPLIAVGLLGLWAIWRSVRPRTPQAAQFVTWAALLMAAMPPVVIAIAGIYRPAYLKFLTAAIGPLAVLLAVPLGYLEPRISDRLAATSPALRASKPQAPTRSWLRWALVVLLLGLVLSAQVRALVTLSTDPTLRRDDYRGIAAAIRAAGRPGDAILLNAPNQWEVFTYYYRSEHGDMLPVYPAPYRPTQGEAEAWVDGIVEQHERLFVLFWGDLESDPDRWIERALAQRAFKADDTWISSVRLTRYGTAPLPGGPDADLDVCLGGCDLIRLLGYALAEPTLRPGDVVPLTLLWAAVQPPPERYKVFVHLVDADDTLIAQVDTEPQGGFLPTDRWVPGETIADHYGLWLPPQLDAGVFRLRVGMYAFSGDRLPIDSADTLVGDALDLTTITVVNTP